jgi:hypothetical protein
MLVLAQPSGQQQAAVSSQGRASPQAKGIPDMNDKAAATADALELLLMNQTVLRAAIEELSTWICQRGSVNAHDNAMVALQALDTNADAITSTIERLRGQP